MTHKSLTELLCFVFLGLLMLSATLSAHAASITIDSTNRVINELTDLGGLQFNQSSSNSLGIFSNLVSSSFTVYDDLGAPLLQNSASAFQLSTISSGGDSLSITAAGMANGLVFAPGPSSPGASALSLLSVTFTLDNWASYNAQHLLSGNVGGIYESSAGLSNVFGDSTDGAYAYSGILAPGTYTYSVFASGFIPLSDDGGFAPAFDSSLLVTIVPEPSSLLLLTSCLPVLIILAFRRSSSLPRPSFG